MLASETVRRSRIYLISSHLHTFSQSIRNEERFYLDTDSVFEFKILQITKITATKVSRKTFKCHERHEKLFPHKFVYSLHFLRFFSNVFFLRFILCHFRLSTDLKYKKNPCWPNENVNRKALSFFFYKYLQIKYTRKIKLFKVKQNEMECVNI